MNHRPGHFFHADMLDSQIATLEEPKEGEENVTTVRLGKQENEDEELGLAGVVQVATTVARGWVG